MEPAVIKRVRGLYQWEIDEFSQIFGNSLNYLKVRVHEGATWTDSMDRIGRKLKGMEKPGPGVHNAITLGNHCYFPINLPETLVTPAHPQSYMLDWLVHELTHAWQYQHMGWAYLLKAIRAQFRDKELAYDFGGQEGLLKSRQKSIPFKNFNPEQQGNITQAYYVRVRKGEDVSAWDQYIEELKQMRL